MINEQSEQPVTDQGPKRIVVRARHRPKRGITLPITREAAALKAAQDEAAEKRFAGTTPQGRDIMRKVIITVRKKLYGTSGRPSAPEQAQGPQWHRVALVISVNKLDPSGEVNQPKEPAARKLEKRKKKFAGTTLQGQGILGKFMAKVLSVLFSRSSAGGDAQPDSVPHYAAQQLDELKSDGPGEPKAELSQLDGTEPKSLETNTADLPLKAQAQPVAATPTQKPSAVMPAPFTPAPFTPAPFTPAPVAPAPVTPAPVTPAPVAPAPVTPAPVTPAPVAPGPVAPGPVAPAPVTPAPVAPATVAPATVAPATVTPTNPAQEPIVTRPRNVVEGYSMAEARRLGLVR